MHVLFLTPWYPNRHDAMDGIFVAKHAQAVASQGAEVTVIRVRTDVSAKDIEIERAERNGVHEFIVYTPASRIPVLRQISAIINFIRGFAKAYKMVKTLRGKPDVTQVNILTRMGVIGYILKRVEGIPYVIIEHWGRYQPSRGQYKGFIRKRVTELVCRNAHCVMTVSEDLARVMRWCGIRAKEWRVVRNTVNDFFYHDQRQRKTDGFCHLLCVTTPDERCKNNTA
ncbi:MAG: glycosyltransferase [Marinilabiliaceae bacterium]